MLLLGIYLIETKALSWRGSCIPMFVVTSLTIAKTWKQAKWPWRNNAQRKSGIYTQWNIRFSSVFQSCLTLCNLMDCGTPGFPVHHQLLEFAQAHAHWVHDAIQPSHPLPSPSLPALNLSQHQGLFKWVSSSYQVAKGLEFQLQHQPFQWIFRTDLL